MIYYDPDVSYIPKTDKNSGYYIYMYTILYNPH